MKMMRLRGTLRYRGWIEADQYVGNIELDALGSATSEAKLPRCLHLSATSIGDLRA